MVDLMQALAWVGVVFIAGFIGYFGKYLSKLVLERLHKRRQQETVKSSAGMGKYEYKLEKERLEAQEKESKRRQKLEKKRLKQQLKRKDKE